MQPFTQVSAKEAVNVESLDSLLRLCRAQRAATANQPLNLFKALAQAKTADEKIAAKAALLRAVRS